MPKKKTQTQAIAKRPVDATAALVKMYEKQIYRALPARSLKREDRLARSERYARIFLTVFRGEKLKACTDESKIKCMIQSAALGLEPGDGLNQCHIIPYGRNAEFQIGFQGFVELAHRSGRVKSIEAHVVHENDDFRFKYGDNKFCDHIPNLRKPGEAYAVWCMATLTNGDFQFIVLTKDDVEKRMHKSKTYTSSSSPWKQFPDEMWKKTAFRVLIKYVPKLAEYQPFAEAVQVDNSSFDLDQTEDPTVIDVDAEDASTTGVDRAKDSLRTTVEVDPDPGSEPDPEPEAPDAEPEEDENAEAKVDSTLFKCDQCLRTLKDVGDGMGMCMNKYCKLHNKKVEI